ncbi:MAG: hypothetical protein HQL66_10820 [Magnetococcales bacterium]|nr:hypothetical protein [Magnetococcales bacterium]
MELLDQGKASNSTEIAQKEKLSIGYVSRMFDLSLLAPDIVTAILDGRQPADLTLLQTPRDDIPMVWEEQRRKYGFPVVKA